MDGRDKDRALDELMEDAMLVASFGQRAGRFEDNSLFAAIRAARARADLDWASPEVADLQGALNKAVRMIHPVTLVDLKTGWNPFTKPKEAGRARGSKVALAFIGAATLLILACGYYTVWYKNAGALLDSIAEAKAEKQTEIVYEILGAMVGANGRVTLSDDRDPGDITHQSMREKIDLARKIDKKIEADQQSYYEATLGFDPTTRIYYNIRSWLYPVGPGLIGSAQAGETGGKAAGAPQRAPVQATWSAVGCNTPDTATTSSAARPGVELQDPAAKRWLATSGIRDFVSGDDRLVTQVRCAIGIVGTNYAGVFANPENVTRDIRQKMDLLGTWLLPALYGALGALMFHMRAFLEPLQPDPSVARVLLRVALGMFAGISVAWFLTPSISQGVGVSSLGLGVLTIAFLLGFSIDVFFALLDRLVTLAKNSISNIGGAAPAPRESPR